MMKMCDILKELRAVQRYGDKSEQTMANRMLNGLYGEQQNKVEIERITLLQYLMTINCKYNGVYLQVKQSWYGIPSLVDLGHFNIVKTNTLFESVALVKDDDITCAPVEIYNLYIEKAERNPISMSNTITLTYNRHFDNDRVKGESNGNND